MFSSTQKRLVLDITRMTIHNGPGLRTLILFKGCPLLCRWCSTPESQAKEIEIGINRKKCNLCGNCFSICPVDAISTVNGNVIIDRKKCNKCTKCAEVCHPGAIQILGRYMSVSDLLVEAEKDKTFYNNSGGGVTLSGGEPLLEPDFNSKLFKALKNAGISIGVDTCGYVPWKNISQVLEYVDFFLWDIKHMDPEEHRVLTGVRNELILTNLKACSDRGTPLYIRIPVIPGCNDSEKNIRATCEFVKELRSVRQIDLLPVHHLGRARYEALDRPYPIADIQLINDERMQLLKTLVESYGIRCTIGG